MREYYIEWIAKKWKNPNKKNKVISLIIIAVLLIGLRSIIYSDGNINDVYIHGMDIPVILAGIIFGIKGGIIGGLAAGFMLAPFSPLAIRELGFGSIQNIINWGIRTSFLVVDGAIIGISFELLKIYLDKLEKVSLFDSESGLPNRNKLIKDLDDLAVLEKSEDSYLIFINLENYSEIINTIGHDQSVEFIQQVLKEFQNRLDKNISIYNIYGNKFGILITDCNRRKISSFVNEIIQMLEEPFVFNRIPIYLNTYLGIAKFSKESQDEKRILQNAYVAMNKAREKKKEFLYYTPNFEKKEKNNLSLLGEVGSAIEKEHFFLHYQPKLDLKTGEITGVEALIRWQHPEKGLIPPYDFIPEVEKTALINNLTYWVIKKAVEDLLKLEKENLKLSIAINIVPRNLKDKEFPQKLEKIITKNNIDPQKIELELTETDIMEELNEGKNILSDLADRGFKISLDDFGTGYSSLAYLKNLPIHNIKVDRSFVKNILVDSKDREIVNAAVQLGHVLDKKVIAEGVESKKELELIKEMGCDFAQGYFIGKPVPYDELKEIHFS